MDTTLPSDTSSNATEATSQQHRGKGANVMERLSVTLHRRERSVQRHLTVQQPVSSTQIQQPEQLICPSCKGAGYLRIDVPFGHPGFGKPLPCHCRVEQTKQQ